MRITDDPTNAGHLRGWPALVKEDVMEDPRTVLLVDDDEDIRTIGALSLEQVGGLTTRLAGSGHEALSAALAERPDVILLDMMMPDLDGLGTIALLRANPATADIPVIFMTAKVQQRDVGGYVDAGAIGVIAKPFDPLALADEVKSIVAGAATSADQGAEMAQS